MKKFSIIFTAVLLALLTAAVMPAQVFADSLPEYISEVKVYQGSYADAKAEGFTILSDEEGKPVDLNQGAGATGMGAKGNKKVYLGYKTTTDRDDAITDLALMNMKGGYDVAEYEALMEDQMNLQIIPFVDGFLTAIEEYRENYNSGNKNNKQRAKYIHDLLNKFTDDDCDGAGLGDLFLNETIYEMAKPQFDALSDKEKEKNPLIRINEEVRDSLPESEKNKHADILTIVAQSNGSTMIVLENLLARAADTNDDTWFDRFSETNYEDLIEFEGGSPVDAEMSLARQYEDDAKRILEKWDDFQAELLDYDNNVKKVEEYDENRAKQVTQAVENIDKNTSEEDITKALVDYAKWQIENAVFIKSVMNVVTYEVLAEIDYLDGTMLDFFSIPKEEIKDDLTLLYPIVASLSDGQRAGLDFLSLRDLFTIALTIAEGYKSMDISNIETVSIYEGVDRGIYEKGGVALTSDAFRADAMEKMMNEDDGSILSASTIAMIAVTGTTFAALVASATSWGVLSYKARSWENFIDNITSEHALEELKSQGITISRRVYVGESPMGGPEYKTVFMNEIYASKAAIAKYLTIGFTIAMVAFTAVSLYLSYRDMKAHYNVDFTPIPHYMVDKKDIVVYDENNNRTILKNQSAYYKAVECNRKKGDSNFDDIDTCADMNGCVGKQWLALYAQKSDVSSPILASSLKVVVGDTNIPAGYETGIHMFGGDTAFNLNNELFCWNSSAKSVFVYFKVDTSTSSSASTAGSNFTGGNLALAGVGGLALGALVSGTVSVLANKKKKKANAA